jgi:cell division protein FtsB
VVKPAPPSLQSTLVFLGVVLYLGTTVFRLGVQEFHLLKQARLLEEERTAIEAQHQDLRAQIATAKTNAGIERLAREQLGFVMAQEIPVKTVVPATAVQPAAVAQAPASAARPTADVGVPPAMAALSKFFVPLWSR